jgi:hypothetical protein
MHGAPRCLRRFAPSPVRARQKAQICSGTIVTNLRIYVVTMPMIVQDYALDATKGIEYALKEIGGEGVDATLMATDAIPAHEYGLHITKKHGTFVVIGQ